MRVSGELQIDQVLGGFIGEIWFVGEQDDGLLSGNPGQRRIEVGESAERILHAGDPDTFAVFFDGDRLVFQYLEAPRGKSCGHVAGVGESVVVPQNGIDAKRGPQGSQELGARFHGLRRSGVFVAKFGKRNEVASQGYDIGLEQVYEGERLADDASAEQRVVVEIAELGDGEAVQSFRQASERYVYVAHNDVLALEDGTIAARCESDANGNLCRIAEKMAAGGWGRVEKGHSFFWVSGVRPSGASSAMRACLKYKLWFGKWNQEFHGIFQMNATSRANLGSNRGKGFRVEAKLPLRLRLFQNF